jgi:hypothetical protein
LANGHYAVNKPAANVAPQRGGHQQPQNNRQNAYDRNLNSQQTDHVQDNEEEQLLYGEDYPSGEEESHELTAEELQDLENSIMQDDDPQVRKKRFEFLAKLSRLGRPRAWYENVTICGVPVKIKIDSGSSVNTLPWNIRSPQIKNRKAKSECVSIPSTSIHTF